jgi:hypothetical protein
MYAAYKNSEGNIVSPRYDFFLFYGCPLLCFFGILAVLFSSGATSFAASRAQPVMLIFMFSSAINYAHLSMVLFRSHGNHQIFKLYPYRFTIGPVLIFAMLYFGWDKIWFMFVYLPLIAWWDAYHVSMQTYGLGRIYDSKIGNDYATGKRLDQMLCMVVYIGPFLAGASLANSKLVTFCLQPNPTCYELMDLIFTHSNKITLAVIYIGVPFLCYYLFRYYQFYKQGYQFSYQKVILLSTTAAVSIYSWGWNSFGHAFILVNLYHSIQYFGIVWHYEKKHIMKTIRCEGKPYGRVAAFLVFLGLPLSYGFYVDAKGLTASSGAAWFAMIYTCSTIHFWFDGFIWSVKKKQV